MNYLNVCEIADPALKTELETHRKLCCLCLFFPGTCIVKVQYLNCTWNGNDWMIHDRKRGWCLCEDIRNEETASP